MILFLLSCLASSSPQNPPPPSSPTIQQQLLENGSFATLAGVTGAHWCGAEGLTGVEGSVTFATVQPGKRLFQQAAKFQAAPGTPAIGMSLQVRPRAAADVGLVTISEGTTAGEAVNWQLVREVQGPWSAYELVNGVWTAMAFQPDPTSAHHEFTGPGSHVRVYETVIDDAVELWFDAPNAPSPTDVVGLVRPTLSVYGQHPNVVAHVEVLHANGPFGSNPTMTPLAAHTVSSQSPDGRDLIAPRQLAASDWLVFRATNLTPSGRTVKLIWRPSIRLEQRRITYAFTATGTPPAGSATEGVVAINVPHGVWSARTLNFENRFFARFDEAPKAPFFVDLRGHAGTVDFTAVSCTHLRTTAGYADVRDAVLDEVERVVEDYRATQDDYPQPNGGSPWKLYLMDPVTGPKLPPNGKFPGTMPANVRELLRVGFWEREYDDYSRIVRKSFDPTNRHPATRLFWPTYTCDSDTFDTTTANQTTGGGAGRLALEMYRHTGDASFLEIARDYALVMATNGVVDADYQPGVDDIRNGLVLDGGYRVDDESNALTSAPGGALVAAGSLAAPAFLAEVAAELRTFATAHPQQSVLVPEPLLEQVARTAIEVAADLKIFDANNGASHAWTGGWYNFAYEFSDVFAYNANVATAAADALRPLVGTGLADIDAMHATLVSFVASGIADYLERWEINAARNSANAADQSRAWAPAAWLVDIAATLGAAGLDAGEIARVKAQLARVARRLAAFQLPDGVWVNANQDDFFAIDQAGGGGTLSLMAPFFPPSFAQVLKAAPADAALRDAMLTRLRDVFDLTKVFFAQNPNYTEGYLPHYYCANQPGCANSVIQTETRILDNYLIGIAEFDRVFGTGQAATRPRLSILPKSFAPAPGSGGTLFRFTITAPPGEDLTGMLTSRTRIRRHHRTAGTGAWADPVDVWPGNPGDWIFSLNGQTAVLDYTVPQVAGSEFKFEVVSWTVDRRWRAATSLQRW